MAKRRPALIAAAILVSAAAQVITLTVAKLMLVALLGLYFGFGFLIGVYQLLRKLEDRRL